MNRRFVLIKMVLLESHDGTVGLVSPVLAVVEIIADERGDDAGPVVTAEHPGLLHVQVEVEGPPGSAWVCAALCEIPGVHSEGEGGGLVAECQSLESVTVRYLPSVVPARPADVGVKEARQVEVVSGDVVPVH